MGHREWGIGNGEWGIGHWVCIPGSAEEPGQQLTVNSQQSTVHSQQSTVHSPQSTDF